MKMGLSRLASLSLDFYLRHVFSFYVKDDEATTEDFQTYQLSHRPMTVTKGTGKYVLQIQDGPLYGMTQAGLLPFGDDNAVFINYMEVQDGYTLYPFAGQIRFDEPLSPDVVVTANYHYTFINIVTSFSDELIEPPLIGIVNLDDTSRPIELGSRSAWVTNTFKLHAYAISEAQRDDMCDLIRQHLAFTEIPIWDFNKGFPLSFYRELTLRPGSSPYGEGESVEGKGFDPNDILGWMYIENVPIQRNPLQSSDPIERGRAIATLDVEYVQNFS